MRRRWSMRVVLATLVVMLSVLGPADAATTVEGGGSFDDAPVLGAGVYSDTILPQETLFYGVALAAGQRVRIDALVDLSAGSKSNTQGVPDALGGFGLMLYSPLLDRLPSLHEGAAMPGGADFQSDGYTLRGPRVTSVVSADRRAVDEGEDWTGPGVYYFTAAISDTYGDLGAVVEFPLRLKITIDGPSSSAGAAVTGPLGVADAGRAADVAVSHAALPRADHERHMSSAVLVAGALADLALGIAAGLAAGRARARALLGRSP